MSITKQYDYVRKGFRVDGVHYVVTGKTEEEAIRKKLEKIRELEEQRIDSAITVQRWSEIWLETYVAHRRILEKSKRMYKDQIARAILPEIGRLRLTKVTPVRLQQLLNSHAGQSASSVAKLRMTLRALFAQAAANRIIPCDPAAGLVTPEATAGRHRSLTPEERAALLRVAAMPAFDGKKNRSGCWLMLMLRCGLRPGETAALRKTDVDLAARLIRVRQAKESGSSRIKDPKTTAGARTVSIPEDLVPWLERQLADSAAPWLFTQRDKKTPLSETAMRRRWETVKRYMDIELGAKTERVKMPGARRRTLVFTQHALAEDLDLYDIRHTYCTDLEEAGVPINVAKTLMGHADISTTANISTHTSAASIDAARRLLNAAAGGSDEKGG